MRAVVIFFARVLRIFYCQIFVPACEFSITLLFPPQSSMACLTHTQPRMTTTHCTQIFFLARKCWTRRCMTSWKHSTKRDSSSLKIFVQQSNLQKCSLKQNNKKCQKILIFSIAICVKKNSATPKKEYKNDCQNTKQTKIIFQDLCLVSRRKKCTFSWSSLAKNASSFGEMRNGSESWFFVGAQEKPRRIYWERKNAEYFWD